MKFGKLVFYWRELNKDGGRTINIEYIFGCTSPAQGEAGSDLVISEWAGELLDNLVIELLCQEKYEKGKSLFPIDNHEIKLDTIFNWFLYDYDLKYPENEKHTTTNVQLIIIQFKLTYLQDPTIEKQVLLFFRLSGRCCILIYSNN